MVDISKINFGSTPTPEAWQQAVQDVATVINTLDLILLPPSPPAGLDDPGMEHLRAVRDCLTRIRNTWSDDKIRGVLGACAPEKLSEIFRYPGITSEEYWWHRAFYAMCDYGTPQDVRTMMDEGVKHKGIKFNLNAGLGYAAVATEPVAGVVVPECLDNVKLLLSLGADPAHDRSSTYASALSNSTPAAAMLLASRSAGRIDTEQWMKWAKTNNKHQAYLNARAVYATYGTYTVLDDETLVRERKLADSTCLRTIFNFLSRRVEEIYEPVSNTRPVVHRDYSFNDLDERYIKHAYKKLIDMGGDPSPHELGLDKRRANHRTNQKGPGD
jgi:hypothetical protein